MAVLINIPSSQFNGVRNQGEVISWFEDKLSKEHGEFKRTDTVDGIKYKIDGSTKRHK